MGEIVYPRDRSGGHTSSCLRTWSSRREEGKVQLPPWCRSLNSSGLPLGWGSHGLHEVSLSSWLKESAVRMEDELALAQVLTCGKYSVHASYPLPPFKSILSIQTRCHTSTKIRTLVLVHCHGAQVLQRQEPNQKSPVLSPSSPNLARGTATPGGVTASLRRMSFVWLSLESFPHCPWPFLCSPVSFHFSFPLTYARLSLVNWIC